MSLRYRPSATVCVFTPPHARVHDVLPVVSRNASVKYFTPEASDVALMLSEVQVSKYGA